MINHLGIQMAARARLTTLVVAQVTATIEATATGYSRASGDFEADGFEVGMELVGSGFSNAANNLAKTITAVTPTTIEASGTAVEAAGSRTLTVGLPSRGKYENIHFQAVQGEPYFSEEYVPGPSQRFGGSSGFVELEGSPVYFVNVFVPGNVGARAGRAYQDAILAHFPPGHVLTVANHSVRVRGEPAPSGGQMLHSQDPEGFFLVPVTIPLVARVATST